MVYEEGTLYTKGSVFKSLLTMICRTFAGESGLVPFFFDL